MPELPSPVRAALGLAAAAVDEVRRFPDRAIELPMLAVSSALQLSLRAQQRYAALTARGDEVLAGRNAPEEPPAWATFDATPDAPVASDDQTADPTAIGDRAGGDEDDPAAVTELTASANGAASSGRESDAASDAAAGAVRALRPGTAAKAAKAAKTVRAPRNGAPSAFDAAGEQ